MIIVLIAGANRRVGLALTKQCAADGADVIACCRNPPKADTPEAADRLVMR